jgi:hypothetical protein
MRRFLLLGCLSACQDSPAPSPDPQPTLHVETSAASHASYVDVPLPDEPPPDDLVAPRVSLPLEGTIVAHGGGPLDGQLLRDFAELCGDPGKIVLIPTASPAAGKPEYQDKLRRAWLYRGLEEVTVMHTLSSDEARRPGFADPLHDADCVWLGGGAQGRLIDAYVDTPVEDALHGVLLRGGAVGGYSAGVASMTRVMIRRGKRVPVEATGFGLLPEIVVDQHFVEVGREPRLLEMLRRALVVHGETFRVRGGSVVRRCTHEAGCESLADGAQGSFP